MTSRFKNVRGKPEDITPTASEPAAVVPEALKKAESRSPMGVRVRPSLQGNLNQLVEEYKAKGWDISQNTILEHFLSRLGNPEYAQDFMRDLAQRERQK
ncbi:hypothetical protein [Deinococcus sp. 6GRE01]|uniref:hypothetical protein n=1 Tax=Deinococcus sp. 6GRE01 TaxID=2745873 RepID=UPI001E3488FE|nr:hypothetical protein [Deinococcus sp. 6GRE01]MCD0155865.1 hypothetical protein [Deinococcus sp. 6GRE01]